MEAVVVIMVVAVSLDAILRITIIGWPKRWKIKTTSKKMKNTVLSNSIDTNASIDTRSVKHIVSRKPKSYRTEHYFKCVANKHLLNSHSFYNTNNPLWKLKSFINPIHAFPFCFLSTMKQQLEINLKIPPALAQTIRREYLPNNYYDSFRTKRRYILRIS